VLSADLLVAAAVWGLTPAGLLVVAAVYGVDCQQGCLWQR